MRIGSTAGPSYFVPNDVIRCSHGSSTIVGGWPGNSSKRTARGLFFALWRLRNAAAE